MSLSEKIQPFQAEQLTEGITRDKAGSLAQRKQVAMKWGKDWNAGLVRRGDRITVPGKPDTKEGLDHKVI